MTEDGGRRMTDTSREAVERLLQDVTPGPWRESKSYRGLVSDSPSGYDDAESVHAYGGHMICESVQDHNRAFIAAARELVPALLKEREALTAERDALKAAQIDAIRAALEAAAECCVETAKEALDDHALTSWFSNLASEIRALDPAAIAVKLKGDGDDR